jgi:excinuclease UvrABC helicase subunit UvrB
MALCKTVQTSYGVNTQYHKIYDFDVSFAQKMARCKLVSYLTKEDYENNSQFLESYRFTWTGDEFDFVHDENITAKMYQKIKETPEWNDANDC